MNKGFLNSLIFLLAGLTPALPAEVRTLPAEVYPLLKTGNKLAKVWTSPAWDGAKGFSLGKVDLAPGLVPEFPKVLSFFPQGLQRLAVPGSANVLSLTLVDLQTVDHGSTGYYSAAIAVEGRIVDPNGALLVAFSTRAQSSLRESVEKNLEADVDTIAWSLSKDLGKDFFRALEARSQPAKDSAPEASVELNLDPKARLLRLEDLRQNGLITLDEYTERKEAIVKTL